MIVVPEYRGFHIEFSAVGVEMYPRSNSPSKGALTTRLRGFSPVISSVVRTHANINSTPAHRRHLRTGGRRKPGAQRVTTPGAVRRGQRGSRTGRGLPRRAVWMRSRGRGPAPG